MLVPLSIRCRGIIQNQKGPIIFRISHMLCGTFVDVPTFVIADLLRVLGLETIGTPPQP